jgi:hypothetical protein
MRNEIFDHDLAMFILVASSRVTRILPAAYSRHVSFGAGQYSSSE